MTTSPWPYPSYADPTWLGGDGEDRALAAVIRIVRATVAEAGDPVNAEPEAILTALSHLANISERVDWAMLSLVGEARVAGVPWVSVGAALGVTKQAAQQRFASYVRQALEQAEDVTDVAQEADADADAD